MSLVETLAVIFLEFPVGDTVKFKFNMSVIKILLKIHHMLAAQHQTTDRVSNQLDKLYLVAFGS